MKIRLKNYVHKTNSFFSHLLNSTEELAISNKTVEEIIDYLKERNKKSKFYCSIVILNSREIHKLFSLNREIKFQENFFPRKFFPLHLLIILCNFRSQILSYLLDQIDVSTTRYFNGIQLFPYKV